MARASSVGEVGEVWGSLCRPFKTRVLLVDILFGRNANTPQLVDIYGPAHSVGCHRPVVSTEFAGPVDSGRNTCIFWSPAHPHRNQQILCDDDDDQPDHAQKIQTQQNFVLREQERQHQGIQEGGKGGS